MRSRWQALEGLGPGFRAAYGPFFDASVVLSMASLDNYRVIATTATEAACFEGRVWTSSRPSLGQPTAVGT